MCRSFIFASVMATTTVCLCSGTELTSDIVYPARPPKTAFVSNESLFDKTTRTKLDANLRRIVNIRRIHGRQKAEKAASELGLKLRKKGSENLVPVILEPCINKTLTDIDISFFKAAGAVFDRASRSYARILVPVDSIEQLSRHSAIRTIRSRGDMHEFGGIGSYVSESVLLTGASVFHDSGITGSGVKTAVVDMGFSGLSNAVSAGELPSNVTGIDLTGTGLESGSSHGTAVAEHVMDMAPGASLFCLKVDDIVDLENAADTIAARGIPIANHSVGWSVKSYYDDTGPINDIFNRSHDENNVFWTIASGNNAECHWRGIWTDTDNDSAQEFAPSDESIDFYGGGSTSITIFLSWNQFGNSRTDLDLYIYDSDGNLVSYSDNPQTGEQDPVEKASFYCYSYREPYHIVAVCFNGPTENLDITAGSWSGVFVPGSAECSLMDPGCAHGVFTVGASDHAVWNDSPLALEAFSCQGPSNDGRLKPDIVAPDRTSCLSYGIDGGRGTSFSAPTVAGAAALLLQKYPWFTADSIAAMLAKDAVDAGEQGPDNTFGAGKLRLKWMPIVSFADSFSVVPENKGTAEIMVRLSQVSDLDIPVTFAVLGSASNGLDHNLAYDSIVIKAGTTQTPISFEIIDDAIDEDTESVIINLKTVENARLSSNTTHKMIIADNDYTPVITSPEMAEAVEDIPFSYTAVAHDTDGAPVVFFKNIPSWMDSSGASISGIPAEGTGDTSFTVIAGDGFLYDTMIVSVTVAAVNDTPSIYSLASASAIEDSLFTYTAYATDPDDTPTILFNNLPSWLTANGLVVSGTPAEGVKDTMFVVTAFDGMLSTTQTIHVSVTAVNDTPHITTVPVLSATGGSQYSCDIDAYDPDAGERLVFRLVVFPQGMLIDTLSGVITWTPVETEDTDAAIKVIVLDTAGAADTLSFVILVSSAPNKLPVIVPVEDMIAEAGIPFSVTIEAFDSNETDALFFYLPAAPQGMTIDSISGTTSWLPTIGNAGENIVIAGVMDNRGGTDTDTFTITVTVPTATKQTDAVIHSPNSQVPWGFCLAPNPVQAKDAVLNISVNSAPANCVFTVYESMGGMIFSRGYQVLSAAKSATPFAQWNLIDGTGKRPALGTYLAMLEVTNLDGTKTVLKTRLGVTGK